MGLNYVVTKRKVGFTENKLEKFVVKSVGNGRTTFAKLCRKLSVLLGIHRGTVQSVIMGLVDTMVDEIEEGKTVYLGEFGSFRAVINARAVDEASEADATTIRRKKIIFTPGKAFKNALVDMSVTRYAMPDTDYTDGISGNGGTGNSGDGDDYVQDPNA